MTHRSRRWLPAIALITLAAAACSDEPAENIGFGETSQAGSTAATTAAAGSSTAEPSPTTAVGATPAAAPLGDPVVGLTQVGEYPQPVEVAWRPSDGTTYVVEQAGQIVMMNDAGPGAVALDMTDLTDADGERGLLGLAISADGTLGYVNYTNNDGNTRIDEYTIAADGTFDPATRREVLGFDQPYPNHNGGDIDVGPDHMLYIGTGDGGDAGDPDRRALDTSEWLGKMLRIDPRPGADAGYTVPPDNPFVGVDGARPEIWSIGLRNPWRFSFDRSTGDLWIADVGQNQWEEVDVAWAADGGGKGLNFGWSAWEGNHRFNDDQSPDGVTPPIHEYEHLGADCSISGGVRYRGAAIPALVGWYVFADYCSGEIRGLQISDRAVVKQLALGHTANVTAVSEGPDGELFVLSGGGPVYALTPG
jgi:glucose/arabinose dehydrogenase